MRASLQGDEKHIREMLPRPRWPSRGRSSPMRTPALMENRSVLLQSSRSMRTCSSRACDDAGAGDPLAELAVHPKLRLRDPETDETTKGGLAELAVRPKLRLRCPGLPIQPEAGAAKAEPERPRPEAAQPKFAEAAARQ